MINSVKLMPSFDYVALNQEQQNDPFILSVVDEDVNFNEVDRVINDKNLKVWMFENESVNNLTYVPFTFRDEVIKTYHNLNHCGYKATIKAICNKFYWKSIKHHVKTFLCRDCIENKINRKNIVPPFRISIPGGRFEKIHIDIVGPLLNTKIGNKYALTIIDRFTRYIVAAPIASIEADHVFDKLMSVWIQYFGLPMKL